MEALYLPQWKSYLRYLDLPGAEPALVFLPGAYLAGTGAFVPTAVRPELSDRRRIIVDLLGGGFSDRPDDFSYGLEDHAATIATLLSNLGLARCAIVGHSLGGAVAIALAAHRPELVGSLVLAEANLDAVGGPFTQLVTGYSEADFVESGYDDLLVEVRARAAAVDDPVAPVFLGLLSVASPHALHRCAVGVARGTRPIMRELLYDMSIPRIYVFGDRSLPDEEYEILPANGVPVAVVPDAGHGMTADNPAGFARVIEAFLEDHDASGVE